MRIAACSRPFPASASDIRGQHQLKLATERVVLSSSWQRRKAACSALPEAPGEEARASPSRRDETGSASTSSDVSASEPTLSTTLAKYAAEAVANPLFYLVAGLVAIKLVSSLGESEGTIFVLAALPVTLLTLLSKSSVGKQVQDDLEARLPQLQAEADALREAHAAARAASPFYGPVRPVLPGALGSAVHLTGVLPGDMGFDPLGLSAEPARMRWNHEAELLHARWAMMAVVGCPIPELLAMQGIDVGEPVWWKVGASKLNGDLTLNWGGIEGFRIAGKQGIGIIAACQAALMGGPEYARYVGIRSLEPVGVFLPGEQVYPGGSPFDPLGLAKDADNFVLQSVKEIRNGRLAMVAMLGYFVQAWVTRKGPVQNLVDFLEDPAHNNAVYLLSHMS